MIQKSKKILKYLIAGGTGAIVNIGALFFLVEYMNVWYLSGSIVSFIVSFVVSFSLQKFWTFGDTSTERIKHQAFFYFCVSTTNLGMNTFLIYIFVEYMKVHYLMSQILASGLIAISSFFVYSKFIFSKKTIQDFSPS